ncbi:hypothetical protein D3C84_739110 [compost metagenome]
MDLSFFGGVVDRQCFQLALGVDQLPILVGNFTLEAANHHLGQLFLFRHDVTCKALVIQQFQQRSEGLGVAVVRRSSQEQVVLKMRGNGAD